MNEFIVWDKDEKCFYEVDTLIGTINGYKIAKVRPLPENCDSECYTVFSWEYSDSDEMFRDIGLKDINNNKIYANSSIIEFELKDYCPCEVMEMDCECNNYTKHKGYFTFNYS